MEKVLLKQKARKSRAKQSRQAKKLAHKFAHRAIRRHFHPFAAEQLVTTSRSFPKTLRVEFAQPLADLTAEVGPGGFTGLYSCDDTSGFSALLADDRDAVRIASSHFEDVKLGEGEYSRCLKNGLWLGGRGKQRFAVFFFHAESRFGNDSILRVEVAVMPGAAGARTAARILASYDEAIRRSLVLRGRVLSLDHDEIYGTSSLKVHPLRPVARTEIILPAATIDLIERNIVRFAAQRPALAALGLPVRKGVLFYGPPGTGKTHSIRYIVAALRGTTVFLVAAEEIRHLREYATLARALQPAVIVIEDVDLIAEDRNTGNPAQSLLNQLLNEMDGLQEDAEILFILTTNRPEVLESALAARPGRVDQAIEFPLPDDACRGALVRLYAGKLEISDDSLAEIVRRTRGVTASFIKELMRRAAQAYLEAGGTGPVACELFVAAIEEMTLIGGKLNAKLLGAEKHAPGFVRVA